MLVFPHIDPILFKIGIFEIHWYALSYVITIILTYIFIIKMNQKKQFSTPHNIDNLAIIIVLSILFGGRLGYIIFYDLHFFLQNPQKIFFIWEGGMAWHGAFVGVILGIGSYCYSKKIKFFSITDEIVKIIPIGFFLGRLANFLNQELIGRPVDKNFIFAIILPNDPYQIPRHPSQLYESFTEGMMLFLVVNIVSYFYPKKLSLASLVFIIGYCVARIICEFFRQPDPQIGFIWNFFTLGQLLSAIVLILLMIGFFINRMVNIQKLIKYIR